MFDSPKSSIIPRNLTAFGWPSSVFTDWLALVSVCSIQDSFMSLSSISLIRVILMFLTSNG